jgi:hypothetical protein
VTVALRDVTGLAGTAVPGANHRQDRMPTPEDTCTSRSGVNAYGLNICVEVTATLPTASTLFY